MGILEKEDFLRELRLLSSKIEGEESLEKPL